MTRIISLRDHACNMEKGLRLTNSSVSMSQVGREIYQGRTGFITTLLNGMALDGLYETAAEARIAQVAALAEGAP